MPSKAVPSSVKSDPNRSDELLSAAICLLNTPLVNQLVSSSKGEVRLLDHLYDCTEYTDSPSGISSALNVTRSRVTAALSSLHQKGYVALLSDTEDRRRMHATLTDEGTRVVLKQREQIRFEMDRVCSKLGKTRCESLIALLNRCIDLLKGD